MTKRPPPLPSPLTKIVVPNVFHPSSFSQIERCPLSVVGLTNRSVDDLLVPHPAAFFGVVLHHVRHEVLEGRWGEETDPKSAAFKILATAIEEAEAILRCDHVTARLVPLRAAVGRRIWTSNTRSLERWAASVTTAGSNEAPHALRLDRGSPIAVPSHSTHTVAGSEQMLSNVDLRLAGRPDWFAHVDKQHIEVVDFKSGQLTDADGHLLEDHVVQLQLYALMLEATFPGVRVTPFVDGIKRMKVPWGGRQRARLTRRLRALTTTLSAGAISEAEGLARPGEHCLRCRLRPSCSAYLDAAPRWWLDQSRNPRPLPLDVWGDVLRTQFNEQSVTLQIVDASGRYVRVDGISPAHNAAGLREGDAVWFFDLESSEDLNQHGALIQPRNFHEQAPGPRWRPALRMRLFYRSSIETLFPAKRAS